MSIELEVGELKGRMSGIEKEIKELKGTVADIDSKLDAIVGYINQAKGGWKATSFLVAISGGSGAFVAYVIKRFL